MLSYLRKHAPWALLIVSLAQSAHICRGSQLSGITAAMQDVSDAPSETTKSAPAGDACMFDATMPIEDRHPIDLSQETRLVIDQTGILAPGCVEALRAVIHNLEAEKGSQLRVLVVNTLDGNDIDRYASDAFHTWKLGRKGVDDGVLLVVAIGDRKTRIEVGYGLEGSIPDAVAGDVIRRDLRPNFQEKRIGQGIWIAVNDLSTLIRGSDLRTVQQSGFNQGQLLGFLSFLLSLIGGILGRALRRGWKWWVSWPVAAVIFSAVCGLPSDPNWGQSAAIAVTAAAGNALGFLIAYGWKIVLQWLLWTCGAFTLISLALLISGELRGHSRGDNVITLLVAAEVSMFLGILGYQVSARWRRRRDAGPKGFESANRSTNVDTTSSYSSYSWSSSSSSSSSSSYSSSDWSSSWSSSDSFDSSGGGGDSGGGGASSDW